MASKGDCRDRSWAASATMSASQPAQPERYRFSGVAGRGAGANADIRSLLHQLLSDLRRLRGRHMRIIFEPNTLRQSRRRGSVTGVVYFEFSTDRQFPVAGWNDFVVVVANWWRAALEQLREGRAEVDFLFMDGPGWITAVSGGTCCYATSKTVGVRASFWR